MRAERCGRPPALHATSLSPAQAESDVKSGLNGKSANMVKEMVTNSSVNFGSGPSKRQVLIMDEVDGMSGGDRGGVQDLMNSIKASPIVRLRLASPLTTAGRFPRFQSSASATTRGVPSSAR